ncbi:MAG: SUMF1/EgtB/PvdO family nonheme iron enzyme [Planctomycetaceae bacterium]|jgi:serine/threonine protein kinase|nr:SUMF1/EgtB/PvdO family nonheme iron enzyme [Planctomycetaceae bacterium]
MPYTQKTIAGNIASTLNPNEKFGDCYVLRKLLGQGGMGQVWLADEMFVQNGEEQILRQVCIKIVPPEVQHSDEEMQRVKDIFQQTHILHHTNICPLYALKIDERHGFYLVMKYINGQTLNKIRLNLLKQNGKITIDDAVKFLFPIANALDYAHRNKVIHRDIKPDNILIDEFGVPFIIDFGLAAQIHTSMTKISQAVTSKSGTLIYKAPEQWQGELQDAQTDQYALGVVAYEFLSGRVPFIADNEMLLGFQVLQNPVPKIAEINNEVNEALVKVLAKERKKRYENCIEFVKALKESTQKKSRSKSREVEVVSDNNNDDDEDENKNYRLLSIRSNKKKNKGDNSDVDMNLSFGALFSGNANVVVNSDGNETVSIINDDGFPFKAGERAIIKIGNIDVAFRWCPSGKYWMKIPNSERQKDIFDGYRLVVNKGFWISETQVTQELWMEIMETAPSCFRGKQSPVEMTSWDDCNEFIKKLNAKKKEIIEPKILKGKFALPTEAQWEYACRAGTVTKYNCGEKLDGNKACYLDNSLAKVLTGNTAIRTTETGSYPPNDWGIYDMHGNVWEWCADKSDSKNGILRRICETCLGCSFGCLIIFFLMAVLMSFQKKEAFIGVIGMSLVLFIIVILFAALKKPELSRVARGGAWNCNAKDCTSASRKLFSPTERRKDTGFRIILEE